MAHRNRGRLDRSLVDLYRQDDLRLGVVHGFDGDLAGDLSRPVGERHAVAILRLEQTDRIVRKVEFDVDIVEEIVAEDHIDARGQLPCAGYDQLPAPADRSMTLKLCAGISTGVCRRHRIR